MPTVNVYTDTLFKLVNKTFTPQEFEELCFEFGIELEEVVRSYPTRAYSYTLKTSEKQMSLKNDGKSNDLSDRPIFRIDIPANRVDMLCVEGIAMAIKAYLELESPPTFKVMKPPVLQQVIVNPSTAQVRPFIVGAILRDITFTQDIYDSFIELQDKLHNNICRKRSLVAIGTHDLDTLQGPFSYEARVPKDISFIPLNQTQTLNGAQVMDFYSNDRKLSKFLPIIQDKPKYPVLYDSKSTVLSLPPIINSNHSKISLKTRNVFIECTATDLTKAKTVLNTIVTMFSCYCSLKYTCEPVEIVYPDGKSMVTPDLDPRFLSVDPKYINSSVGIDISNSDMASLLKKMSLGCSVSLDGGLNVSVPSTRSDILHACDVMEDVAIAFGFNNIPETHPNCFTIASALPINSLSDKLRREFALSGYTEALTFTLCSRDENFSLLNQPENDSAVILANPKTIEYQVVRTSLLPGLLKTVCCNKHVPLPIKVFEVSDVVLKDETLERRARNQRRAAAIYCSKTSGFEFIHGMVDRLMLMLDIPLVSIGSPEGYYIKESENPTYFPDRRADVFYKNSCIGSFGIVHPKVLLGFEIGFPCSALELDLECF